MAKVDVILPYNNEEINIRRRRLLTTGNRTKEERLFYISPLFSLHFRDKYRQCGICAYRSLHFYMVL